MNGPRINDLHGRKLIHLIHLASQAINHPVRFLLFDDETCEKVG